MGSATRLYAPIPRANHQIVGSVSHCAISTSPGSAASVLSLMPRNEICGLIALLDYSGSRFVDVATSGLIWLNSPYKGGETSITLSADLQFIHHSDPTAIFICGR